MRKTFHSKYLPINKNTVYSYFAILVSFWYYFCFFCFNYIHGSLCIISYFRGLLCLISYFQGLLCILVCLSFLVNPRTLTFGDSSSHNCVHMLFIVLLVSGSRGSLGAFSQLTDVIEGRRVPLLPRLVFSTVKCLDEFHLTLHVI